MIECEVYKYNVRLIQIKICIRHITEEKANILCSWYELIILLNEYQVRL